MSTLGTTSYPTMPPTTAAAVVPGVSTSSTTPPAPPVAAASATGGGAPVPAADPAQLVALLQALVSILQQLQGAQGAQLGAASVQGGGATAVPVGGPSFPATTLGSFGAIGATSMPTNTFGGNFGSTVGGVLLGGSTGTGTSLSGGSVPSFLPSLGAITGGGAAGAPAAGGSFQPTSFGNFSAIGASPQPSVGAFGASAGGATSTIGGFVLGGTPGTTTNTTAAPVAGGGAVAAGAAPQIDMRRMTGSPRSGDVIDTIIRSAVATAQPSKSEGQYIVVQDAGGAQLQAHVHGAWASHPTRLLEGIQRGFIQVHVHEDGTLHLHDVA